MDTVKTRCEALDRRLAMLKSLPDNPWIPGLTEEMEEKAAAGIEKGFREALIIGRPPDWAEPLRQEMLIDWHDVLGEADEDALYRLLTSGDYKNLYLDRDGRAASPSDEELAQDPLFIERLGAIARLLTEFMASGGYLLRLRPEWFLFHGRRLWAHWALLEKHSTSENRGMIRAYEPGWMHPALRKREVPGGISLAGAVSHTFAYLILYTLTRMPPPRTLGDFAIQVDRFRAYSPELSPLLRPFFRKWLLDGTEEGTPLECWRDLEARLSDIRKRSGVPFAEGRITCRGDSAFGRNKRHNDNEDTILILDGLPSTHGLAGVADGVSTAAIGSGWAASAAIKRMFQVHRDTWVQAVAALPSPDPAAPAWEEKSGNLFNEIFEAAHGAVAEEINRFAEARGKKERAGGKKAGPTMSSTLALALVIGNWAVTAHWGDSRAYLVAEDGLVRLTEDHNHQLLALVQGGASGEPYRARSEDDGHLVRTVGACRWNTDISAYEPAPLAKQPVALNRISLKHGEAILLCSDGLLSGISALSEGEKETVIWDIYQSFRNKGEREIALGLVRAADDDRGDDNISVVVMTYSASKSNNESDNEEEETENG